MATWLLLIYKLPAEPTRYRASIWRKLKGLGAVYLQQGAAALPADAESEAAMRELVQEMVQMQGTASLAQCTWLSDEADIVAAFNAARTAEYTELLDRCQAFHKELAKERAVQNYSFAELEENEDDLHKLETWLTKVRQRDRFGIPLCEEAEQALTSCRADLEAFAATVYRTGEEGAAPEGESGSWEPDPPHKEGPGATDPS